MRIQNRSVNNKKKRKIFFRHSKRTTLDCIFLPPIAKLQQQTTASHTTNLTLLRATRRFPAQWPALEFSLAETKTYASLRRSTSPVRLARRRRQSWITSRMQSVIDSYWVIGCISSFVMFRLECGDCDWLTWLFIYWLHNRTKRNRGGASISGLEPSKTQNVFFRHSTKENK